MAILWAYSSSQRRMVNIRCSEMKKGWCRLGWYAIIVLYLCILLYLGILYWYTHTGTHILVHTILVHTILYAHSIYTTISISIHPIPPGTSIPTSSSHPHRNIHNPSPTTNPTTLTNIPYSTIYYTSPTKETPPNPPNPPPSTTMTAETIVIPPTHFSLLVIILPTSKYTTTSNLPIYLPVCLPACLLVASLTLLLTTTTTHTLKAAPPSAPPTPAPTSSKSSTCRMRVAHSLGGGSSARASASAQCIL